MRPLLVAVAAIACLGAAACSPSVGDACAQNVDCDPLGTRFCDLSVPGGYCTVEGCDSTSCPTEAVCVRFFAIEPGKTCDPSTYLTDCGAPSERCLCDCEDPAHPGQCLVPSRTAAGVTCPKGAAPARPSDKAGHCAPESSEDRWCMLACQSDSDCSRGFKCFTTGLDADGAESVPPPNSTMSGTPVSYCAPPPPPMSMM